MIDDTAPELTWSFTPHICRCCWARVMTRLTIEGQRVYRCANCGTQVEGSTPAVLCACGVKIRGKDAGIRCKRNDRRTPENPAEIVAEQISVAP